MATKAKRHRIPRGWRYSGPNESAACPHRDLSVCAECAERYADRLVDVYGATYWMETDAERDDLLAHMAK
jgi:hypothetical protein